MHELGLVLKTLRSRSTTTGVVMAIPAAQEERGKRDGTNGFGYGLGLREEGTGSHSPNLAFKTLKLQRSMTCFRVLQCLPSPSPQRTNILTPKWYLTCVS